MTVAEKALEIAIREIGKEEIPRGSNWGLHVQKYLSSVGLYQPNPWCMSFVYWCFNEAAREMGVKNPLAKTGSVMQQYALRGDKYAVQTPRPGDMFIIDHGQGKGHTGFVWKPSIDMTTVKTVEGNSNDEGSREGYEVCSLPARPHVKMKAYLRFL